MSSKLTVFPRTREGGWVPGHSGQAKKVEEKYEGFMLKSKVEDRATEKKVESHRVFLRACIRKPRWREKSRDEKKEEKE